tara:strand:+ start:7342 stop:8031 length:690 start_codon:yes stop_codon:yes gene_type:complete
MNALILAAGYGKRLRPITNEIPKCLVKIKDKILLNIWLENLLSAGIKKILINTHHLADQVENFVKDSSYSNKIKIVREKTLLGTAGTLNANINFFGKEDGILMHGDNYCLENITSLISAHKKRPPECLMTMLTFKSSDPSSCGIVSLDNRGVVKNFYEKKKENNGNIANGAIYILSNKSLEIIKNNFSEAKDFSTEIIKNFLGKIYTFQTNKFFTDIGTLEEYETAQKN